MIGYNSQCEISQSIIDKLPWIEHSYNYIFTKSNIVYNGIAHSISEGTYEKLKIRLEGSGKHQIKSGDRVFLMPGYKIPLYKLKSYLDSIDAKLTNDVDKATVFIGTSKISGNSTQDFDATNLIFSDRHSEITDDGTTLKSRMLAVGTTSIIPISSSITLLYPDYYVSSRVNYDYDTNTEDWINDSELLYFITPLASKIIYNSISKKLPIINEDELIDQLPKLMVIDQDQYETINDMFNSKDKGNYNVAGELMANCDIDSSLWFIRKLAKNHYSKINLRMKNIRLFVQKAEWNELNRMDAEEFLVYMNHKGYLDQAMFDELVIEAAKLYEKNLHTSAFKMILVPSDNFAEFTKESDRFEFNHKNLEKDVNVLLEPQVL